MSYNPDIHHRVEAMEKLQESIHEATMKFLKEMEEKHIEQEKRLDSLEQWQQLHLQCKEHKHE